MVSVPCLEVVLCESDVRFCRIVVFACNGGLVTMVMMVAGSFHRAGMCSLSAVACLVINGSGGGGIISLHRCG